MLDLRVKKLFFDAPAVRRANDRVTRDALGHTGAFIRQAARRSMKKAPPKPRAGGRGRRVTRPRYSRPGQPPYSRTGLLKRHIYYSYDPRRQDVVIGPAALRSRPEVPRVLEEGGKTVRSRGRGRGKRRARYAARPYMGPALRAGLARLKEFWAQARRKVYGR